MVNWEIPCRVLPVGLQSVVWCYFTDRWCFFLPWENTIGQGEHLCLLLAPERPWNQWSPNHEAAVSPLGLLFVPCPTPTSTSGQEPLPHRMTSCCLCDLTPWPAECGWFLRLKDHRNRGSDQRTYRWAGAPWRHILLDPQLTPIQLCSQIL